MRRIILLLLSVCCIAQLNAQNPATVFNIPNRTIILPCGSSACTNFSASVPHIKQTNNYVITRPAYVPFAYTTPTGTELTAIYTDDMFSSLIQLPFPFCFYGATYNSLVMGSNAVISFDASLAGQANSWPLTDNGSSGNPVPIPYAGGTQNSSFSTYYPKASIMGPYHDIFPTNNAGGQRKIEWRIEGVSPTRRFIGSYNVVPMFSCTTTNATSMIVIYESTGIVEVYVHDKPICTAWNTGLAILGVQNFNRDQAVAADGKNCTVWGGLNIDSCYRFVPSQGVSRFVSAGIYVNGTFIAAADTSTTAPGVLKLNWPNVCPTADSTAYELRVAFSPCGTSEGSVVFKDTIFVKRASTTNISVAKTDATCTTGGTITITATGGTPPYEYSINGGTNWQLSNSFTNVAPGTYTATARVVNSNCPAIAQQVTIAQTNTLAMTVTPVNATCTGGSITINATGGTAPLQYSINGGQTYQTGNTFNGVAGGTYNVMVRDASGCTRSQQVTLTFTNNLTVSQNQQTSLCAGQAFTPTFTSNATTFSWSPTTGVSNSQALNPTFTPQTTTTYTLTATLGTCTQTRTVVITVTPGATVNAGPDATIIAGDSYQMLATASAGTYNWTVTQNPNTTISTLLNPVVTPATTTNYTLRVTTGAGCTASDDVTINVVAYCIKPMEAFTPNGDGINDLWLITNGNCLTSARAQVFNRYGSKVFESNDYKNTWNGTYDGKPLPDGTYYYVISFRLVTGREVVLKGNVTILR